MNMYPALPKSYKGMYPFKIGTTSYIYPDHVLPNVKMLAPYLDEIEIVMYEGQSRANFPSKNELYELAGLAKEFSLAYNIHLPMDLFLGHRSRRIRNQGIETIKYVIDLTAPISPTTHTLHLEFDEESQHPETVQQWLALVHDSMEQLVAAGIECESISIENLSYPLEWIEGILNDFSVSVCMDLGHLMVHREDMEAVFRKYANKTSIIHLHGVKNHRDHRSLADLGPEDVATVMRILQQFKGIVSLEIFSFEDLKTSLGVLEKFWQNSESASG